VDLDFLNLLRNARSRFRGNIVFVFIYSDSTNTIDAHMIITIILIFELYSMYFVTDGFVLSMFDSCY
jgi:hypothetical protein